jgi:hypothetical protein
MQNHIWNSIACSRLSFAFRISFAFGVLLIAAFCQAPPMTRGQSSPPPAKSSPAHNSNLTAAAASVAPRQASTAARPSGGGPHESIQVHGHWVIEVRRPNGKLVSHTEFENKLVQPSGQFDLALLLSGYVPGDWEIQLDAASPAPAQQKPICTNSDATSGVGPCDIDEAGGYFQTSLCPGTGEQCFPTLHVVNPNQVTPTGTTQSDTVTLQGTATSAMAGEITDVETQMEVCYPTVTPSVCQTGNGIFTHGPFTAATLPASNTTATPCGGTGQISCAVNVPEAGDTINATVTISFQ